MKYIKLFENKEIEEITKDEYSDLFIKSIKNKIKYSSKEDICFFKICPNVSYEPFRDSYVKLKFKDYYLEVIKLPEDYYAVYNTMDQKCYKIDQFPNLVKYIKKFSSL